MEAGDDVDFALDPAGVVGGGAWERVVEELLVGLSEASDVDDDGLFAGDGEFAEGEAEGPGDFWIEGGEAEELLLVGDAGDVVGEGHAGLCSLLPLCGACGGGGKRVGGGLFRIGGR